MIRFPLIRYNKEMPSQVLEKEGLKANSLDFDVRKRDGLDAKKTGKTLLKR